MTECDKSGHKPGPWKQEGMVDIRRCKICGRVVASIPS